ncbi:flavin reductase family protein [Micromonospora sp. KLBMP9576]|uniref:flavin reductase family protein n=1 Tax=Micromonospora sp. KLBMP9576 TaxID=3424769 RepID=UPI003D9087B0
MVQLQAVEGRPDQPPPARNAPELGTPPGAEEFRQFMSNWPTGVSVVTSRHGRTPVGCTVNAMMSVSLSPPLLVISLGRDSGTLAAIRSTGAFALNVLCTDQRELCRRFARGAQSERFRGVPVQYHRGLPVLSDALAATLCTVRETADCGDHVLVVGMPGWQRSRPDIGPPLVFHRHHLLGLADPGEG